MWFSDLIPSSELLKISFKLFMAWTCGRFVTSALDNFAGLLAKTFNSSITFSKAGLCPLEDNIPVINAGIPAERLVVDACSNMHCKAPW
jgi:hypothetical protein